MTGSPFIIPENPDEVVWIMERVRAWRPFEEPHAAGWKYGANHTYMQKLRDHWLDRYDWPAQVAQLNTKPHFRSPVGATALHYVHVRSNRADAFPLLISHGWPSTVYEFWKVLDALANPDDPSAPAFHVIAPSLPGYGWSDKPLSPIGPRAIARLYDALMTDVLGYKNYIAQGGDWGSLVTAWLGLESKNIRAIHLNGYGLRATDITPTSPDQVAWLKKAKSVRETETAYLFLQATKPQSLGFAMMDSPMGVAAWLCEKFCGWSDTLEATNDPPFALDDVLTEIMIFLTTRTFATSTWLYRGYFEEAPHTVPAGTRVEIPTGVANFPHDLLSFPPRAMAERAYNIQHWTDMPRGGHFAAWEEPGLFVQDVRKFVQHLPRSDLHTL
jgi:pimeloyl-ACP methyl ester carboxylesterase